MSQDRSGWLGPACVSAVLVAAVSCGTAPGPDVAAGDPSLPPPIPVTSASLDASLARAGAFDIVDVALSVRRSAFATTVRADLRATARETTDRFELDYCGPPVMFVSVDGSTVETTVAEGVLRAALHAPLRPDDEIVVRFLTDLPGDRAAAPPPPADIGAELLCR